MYRGLRKYRVNPISRPHLAFPRGFLTIVGRRARKWYSHVMNTRPVNGDSNVQWMTSRVSFAEDDDEKKKK